MRTRERRITVRLTEEEYNALQERVERSGLRQNAFVLHCIAQNPINVIEGISDVLKALRQIGNNLNQIARAVNAGLATNQPVIEELQKGVDELWLLLRWLKAGRV